MMERVMDGIRRFAERDWTMAEKALALAGCFLLGVAGGFCLAPIKPGISLGSNNGNTYNHGYSGHGKTSGRKKSKCPQ